MEEYIKSKTEEFRKEFGDPCWTCKAEDCGHAGKPLAFLRAAMRGMAEKVAMDAPLIPANSNPFRKVQKIDGKVIDVGDMNGWDVAYVSQMDLHREWQEQFKRL